MSLGTILQTILAVIFIYLILSLITSEIQEAIASFAEFRAKRLKESIKQLLGEDSENNSLTELLYEKYLIPSLNQSSTSIFSLIGNPKWKIIIALIIIALPVIFIIFFSFTIVLSLIIICGIFVWLFGLGGNYEIQSIKKNRKNRKSKGPSYIEPQSFSQSMLQVIEEKSSNDFINSEQSIHGVISVLEAIDEKNVAARSKLLEIARILILEKDDPKLLDFKAKLEELFKEAQERSSGVYKRNAKGVSFVLGFLIAMIVNADAFSIISNLSKDNNSFGNRLVNELEENKSTLFPDKDQANAEYGLNDEKEELIIKILNEVGTLPLGWNFDRELETQNLKSLIEILDGGAKEPICFDEDSYKEKKLTDQAKKQTNKKCFEQFLEDIEKNPHLESYFQPAENTKNGKDNKNNKNSHNNEDDKRDHPAKKKFINDLAEVKKCLESKDKVKVVGECLQNKEYDFPTTYRTYRQHLNNSLLSQRIDNIKTPNKKTFKILNKKTFKILNKKTFKQKVNPVHSQVKKQGGWPRVIFGWVVSAFAISMGAPFWFDLLGKVMNVRNAGKPISEKTNAEKTKETQEET